MPDDYRSARIREILNDIEKGCCEIIATASLRMDIPYTEAEKLLKAKLMAELKALTPSGADTSLPRIVLE